MATTRPIVEASIANIRFAQAAQLMMSLACFSPVTGPRQKYPFAAAASSPGSTSDSCVLIRCWGAAHSRTMGRPTGRRHAHQRRSRRAISAPIWAAKVIPQAQDTLACNYGYNREAVAGLETLLERSEAKP